MNNDKVWDEFNSFINTCKKNRVFPECDYISKLKDEIPNLEITIGKGMQFYRARAYRNSLVDKVFDFLQTISDDKEHESEHYDSFQKLAESTKAQREAGFKGYDAKGSFVCPDLRSIQPGRCNHAFEQCLYVAEDVQTAISELKPLIQEQISVACIQVEEPLKIIDFGFDRSDSSIIKPIALLFVTSPTLEGYDAYIYTQVLCSLVKNMGYDGIRYSSCQIINKSNLAIFNYDKCKAISSNVYEVTRIDYDYKMK